METNNNTCRYPKRSIGYYKHCSDEFDRVKKLAANATGHEAEELYIQLDGIRTILEDLCPHSTSASTPR